MYEWHIICIRNKHALFVHIYSTKRRLYLLTMSMNAGRMDRFRFQLKNQNKNWKKIDDTIFKCENEQISCLQTDSNRLCDCDVRVAVDTKMC